jgi:hypothetical protein
MSASPLKATVSGYQRKVPTGDVYRWPAALLCLEPLVHFAKDHSLSAREVAITLLQLQPAFLRAVRQGSGILTQRFREFGALVGGQMFVLHDKPQVIDL